MALSPLVLVQDGAGPWVATTNGVDVTPGNTIGIKLADTSSATDWYLQILGTDEVILEPVLTGVNPLDNKVTTTTTVVTFTMPAGTGHALRFESRVLGTGGPLTTTFGIYSLTDLGTRVGASGEELEGNGTYGWITITNPILRSGAAVTYYNDAAVSPTWGVNTVQAALDYLKASPGGVLKKSYDLNIGTMTALTLAANATIIGADYFNPVGWVGDETGLTRNVYFRAILSASVGTITAYARLYDLNGITNGGVPQVVPGSTLSTTNTSPTYYSVNLTSVLGAVTLLGVLEAELYVSATGSSNAAVCQKAWIDVEWS